MFVLAGTAGHIMTKCSLLGQLGKPDFSHKFINILNVLESRLTFYVPRLTLYEICYNLAKLLAFIRLVIFGADLFPGKVKVTFGLY